MKKIFTTFLMVFTVMASYAYDVEIDGIYYNLNKETKEAAVTYEGRNYYQSQDRYSGVVTIPSTITYNDTTYSVTSIGDGAFYCCFELISVTIPNSITSIGKDTFSGCSGLKSVEIPNSVTSIGDDAFRDCSGLTSVEIPNSVASIGERAFGGCYSLISVTVKSDNPNYCSEDNVIYTKDKSTLVYYMTSSKGDFIIPNSVTSIGDWAFYGCSGLTSVTIPNSVTSIGEWAFADCTSLTSVSIPNSVTNTGHATFSGCTGLISIVIPNSVTTIGDYSFYGCIYEA